MQLVDINFKLTRYTGFFGVDPAPCSMLGLFLLNRV
jgi:hypothetical protein